MHLAFGLHASAALLLLFIGVGLAAVLPVTLVASAYPGRLTSQGADNFVSLTYSAAAGVYLYHAFRRAYGDGRAGGAAKAVWLVLAYWVSIGLYRVLLFFVTFWTT